MSSSIKIAVCSRSFSINPILRNELLKRYPNVKFNENGKKLKGKDLIDFISDSEKAIIGLEEVNEDILLKVPKLKLISKYGVGLDSIDLVALKTFGVKVSWVGGVNRRSVSELTLCNVLSLIRKIPESTNKCRNNIWEPVIGSLLSGKTIGIVGCGHIGKDLINLLKPFDCNILVNDLVYDDDFINKWRCKKTLFDELVRESDVISFHVPLNDSTRNMLNKKHFQIMRKNAIVINTSRGGIVNEEDLKNALINNMIYAAAIDVFVEEPPTDLDFLRLSNLLPTTHIGGSAYESIIAMGMSAIDGLDNHSMNLVL